MKNLMITMSLWICSASLMGQSAEVMQVLSKYNLKPEQLEHNANTHAAQYNFDIRRTTTTMGKTTVYDIHHHAGRQGLDAWELRQVNGQQPGSADMEQFNKEFSKVIAPVDIDYNSIQVVLDQDGELVLSYKMDAKSLNADNNFMKDCSAKTYIDTKTGHIKRTEVTNDKTLKVKLFKVPSLHVENDIRFDSKHRHYLPVKEETEMTMKVLGSNVHSHTLNEYSNFSK